MLNRLSDVQMTEVAASTGQIDVIEALAMAVKFPWKEWDIAATTAAAQHNQVCCPHNLLEESAKRYELVSKCVRC